MNHKTAGHAKDLAASLALDDAAKSPEMSARTAEYLDEQIALSKAQQAQLEREAALHELHVENLKLQSEALRAQQAITKDQHEHIVLQKKQLRSQRLHDHLRSVYQGVLSLIMVAVLAIIVYAVYTAATDHSVVVNQFQVPPPFVAEGNSGTVVASGFLDQLQVLQASTHDSQSALALQDAWSHNIRVQVPDVHVSLGDIGRTLRHWLGHETEINGQVVQQGNQIALTVRGTGIVAKTFSGASDALPALIISAADYVYGQAEPYQFVSYLESNSQTAQALQLVQAAYPAASAKEKPWLLNAWAIALLGTSQAASAMDKEREALRLDPHFRLAYIHLELYDVDQGEEEAAYQTGVRMERLTPRGSWFGFRVPETHNEPLDSLRMDLPAIHRELLADEAAHGGVGITGRDAFLDAETLVRMHADRQALFTLHTAPDTGSNPNMVAADTDSVQGMLAMDQSNYEQAVNAYEAEQSLYTQYPALGSFNDTDAALLALADELSGHPDKADTVMTICGHYVDCHWYAGDVAAERGDWGKAEQEYAAAVTLAPDLPDGYQGWGEALLRRGNYKEAIEKFQQANQRGPHWCDPLKYWGDALAAQGNYKQAIEKYAEASKYTLGWGALELVWGQALDKLGKHKQAMAHYQAAQANKESMTAAEQTSLMKRLVSPTAS